MINRNTVIRDRPMELFPARAPPIDGEVCAHRQPSFIQSARDSSGHQPMETAVCGDFNAASKNNPAEAAMRLPILRTSLLALVLAATPASLSGEFLIPPSNGYIVLAMSDVLACDPPHSIPSDAENSYLRASYEGDAVPLWRADIYDLAECLRMKAETI